MSIEIGEEVVEGVLLEGVLGEAAAVVVEEITQKSSAKSKRNYQNHIRMFNMSLIKADLHILR